MVGVTADRVGHDVARRARVARQPSRRFRGTMGAVLEERLVRVRLRLGLGRSLSGRISRPAARRGPVHSLPAPHDPLDVGGWAGPPDRQEMRLGP
jgi:hypothetical protein